MRRYQFPSESATAAHPATPRQTRKKSGLNQNAATGSRWVHASKLRVEPHAGQGTPVSLRSAQKGRGSCQRKARLAANARKPRPHKSASGCDASAAIPLAAEGLRPASPVCFPGG